MPDSTDSSHHGMDPEELSRILRRVVRQVCPAWLASEREDLAQNVFLRIVRKWSRREESIAVAASYLWRAAHSVVMDEIRRRRRRPEAKLESSVSEILPGPAHSPHPGGMAVRQAIRKGLRTLSEPRRSAVVLHLYGFSLQESARILGWSPKRVDNQRYQGLAQLRKHLREQGVEP